MLGLTVAQIIMVLVRWLTDILTKFIKLQLLKLGHFVGATNCLTEISVSHSDTGSHHQRRVAGVER